MPDGELLGRMVVVVELEVHLVLEEVVVVVMPWMKMAVRMTMITKAAEREADHQQLQRVRRADCVVVVVVVVVVDDGGGGSSWDRCDRCMAVLSAPRRVAH